MKWIKHRNKLVLCGIAMGIGLLSACGTKSYPELLSQPADSIRISSPDTALVKIFNWAQKTSNGYVGSDDDPVGPWYEAALPNREAFCIRDVSHQSIGAEILWQGKQNLNMFRKFVENISESKDWCSFWEINRYNLPAPVDYVSDDDFWYNLNANFDIIDACWKLYEWTGNRTYIEDPVFDRFFRLTLHEFVDKWQLGPDVIMDRPAFMNRKPETKKYYYARGIPSYDEQQEDISVSGDLIGMIYNGFRVYAHILNETGRSHEAAPYREKASQYLQLIDSLWWNREGETYHGFYKQTEGRFYPGGISNSEFLLWYHVISNPDRIDKSLQELRNSQVEVLSYLPMLFYRYGYNRDAYDFLGKIYTDKRRMYPEASSGAIEGIVRGMMGVEPAASENRLVTLPRLIEATTSVTVENIPIFSGLISIHHEANKLSILANRSDRPIIWRASFPGSYRNIRVDGRIREASQMADSVGNQITYVDVEVGKQRQVTAELITKDVVRNARWPDLEEVILVWKTHNDIGYTHSVPEVLDYYRTGMMDHALSLIEDTLNTPRDERFVWVLPAWVMEVILDEKQTPERRTRIERAIYDGRIVWHALPYTFESEAADLEELVRCLGSGTRLAKQFGQPLPTDAKLTDVPSQAWVLPTLLANAGIRFVHIGVNPWSPNPDVPVLFWWEGPDGSRVLTGYSFDTYSWGPLPPEGWKHKTWLCFQVTGDNSGPPARETVQRVLNKIRRELPGVKFRFGRPSDFSDAILADGEVDIPVVRGDMPDTWTHGQMTMPVPTQIHRRVGPEMASLGVLATTLSAWDPGDGNVETNHDASPNDISTILADAYEQGCLFTEHTWGIMGPAFGTPDHATWKRELAAGSYTEQLATFKWHADYAYEAERITGEAIAPRIGKLAGAVKAEGPRAVVFNPLPWPRSGMATVKIKDGDELPSAVKELASGRIIPVSQSGQTITFAADTVPPGGYSTYALLSGIKPTEKHLSGNFIENNYFQVRFDTVRGGIASLVIRKDGRELVRQGELALGQFLHEQFSKADVDAFMKAYNHVYYEWYGFPFYDFNKPKLDPTLEYTRMVPSDWSLSISEDANGHDAVLTTRNTLGLAEEYSMKFFFPANNPYVEITWTVNGKTPELIPEGGWVCFPLAVEQPAFRISHVCAPFSPETELVPGTNNHLFSTDYGISVRQGATGPGVGVVSSDLPLWSIGAPGLWKFSQHFEPREPVLFANLYNNQWNTNFPLWVDGSWSATIRLWPVANGASEEESLFTPGWELRQDFITGYANGSAGSLATSSQGLSLSRKGIRLTAFCPNPDAEQGVKGTLLRVWEQSGQSGEVELTLPAALHVTRAQPVTLRGEKNGKPLKIRNGKLVFTVKAYAPASFVLD